MENILQANSLKLEILRPLAKWRILGLQELKELASLPVSYWQIQRIVSRFEGAKILKSFRDPWTNKKLVYLENLGKGMFGYENATHNNPETLLHDSKVSEICRSFLERKGFNEVLLEHELSKKLFYSGELSPDAIFTGEKSGKSFSMAFELELTRKANERMLAKAKHYLNSNLVNYVLYFFCNEPLCRNYKNIFSEGLPDGWNNKLILIWNPSLISNEMNLEKGIGYFQKKEIRFNEIF